MVRFNINLASDSDSVFFLVEPSSLGMRVRFGFHQLGSRHDGPMPKSFCLAACCVPMEILDAR